MKPAATFKAFDEIREIVRGGGEAAR